MKCIILTAHNSATEDGIVGLLGFGWYGTSRDASEELQAQLLQVPELRSKLTPEFNAYVDVGRLDDKFRLQLFDSIEAAQEQAEAMNSQRYGISWQVWKPMELEVADVVGP